MKNFRKLFSLEGRATRQEYLSYLAIAVVLKILSSIVESNKDSLLFLNTWLFAGPFMIMIFLFLGASIAVQVRRYHDLNMSGWWVFINLVPFVNIYFAIVVLGLKKGNGHANKYGEVPLHRSN